jgi:hypothetical protein
VDFGQNNREHLNSNISTVTCITESQLTAMNSMLNEVRGHDNSTINVINSTVNSFMIDPPAINLVNLIAVAEIHLAFTLPDESLLSCTTLESCETPLPTNLRRASEHLKITAQFDRPMTLKSEFSMMSKDFLNSG